MAQGDCRVICLTHVSRTQSKKDYVATQVSRMKETLNFKKKSEEISLKKEKKSMKKCLQKDQVDV